jgi:nucleoside-diphosphate-sugar epimerase
MSVAIIGANSQVGTELAVLLRNRGHPVVPVVRNQLAGAFFEQNGFDIRIGDVTNVEDADRVLHDAEGVLIAAYVRRWTNAVPKRARELNLDIARNAVRYSADNATIIYFSSISAFGKPMYGPDLPEGAAGYAKDKRHLENAVTEACERHDKPCFPLRLGIVMGPFQARTKTIIRTINSRQQVYLGTDPEDASNVLDTETHPDAIDRSLSHAVAPDRYTDEVLSFIGEVD